MKISIHQIKEVECPVWADDAMTGEFETRVLVVFKRVKSLKGLEMAPQFASLFMMREYTLDVVKTALPIEDEYSKLIKFEAKEDSTFFKAIIL